MQGTEHDIAFFLALGCAIALHCIALHCIVVYCIALYCISWMSLVSFLVTILKLPPSSRILQLSIRSSFAEVSGLGSGLNSEPGSQSIGEL